MQAEDLMRRVLAFADAHDAGETPLPTGIADLAVMRQRAPTPLKSVVYRPVFCLVLQGAKQAFVGDRTITFEAMQSVIISVEVPTLARVVRASRREPYVAMALGLDMALLTELAAEIGAFAAESAEAAPIATGVADEAVIDAMARLFALVDTPQAVSVLRPLILREIHYWLLSARHGTMLRALARADSAASRIARATAMIRRDYAAPLRIANLADAAGMSASAFHDHFKAVTGTTPIQYQKQLRLMEARHLILAGGHSVSSAAFEVGYGSPTQFSREYARKFGASPRADMKSATPEDAEAMAAGP